MQRTEKLALNNMHMSGILTNNLCKLDSLLICENFNNFVSKSTDKGFNQVPLCIHTIHLLTSCLFTVNVMWSY